MKTIISYFEHQPDSHRIAILIVTMLILWNVEAIAEGGFSIKKWKHAFTNALFMLTDAPVQGIFGVALVYTTSWVTTHHFGLIHHIGLTEDSMLQFLVIFILLDFFEYIYHWFMHRYKPLWMFHVVHHSERDMDVSTVFREHPGETSIRLTFLTFFLFLSGASFWMLLFRQAIQIVSNVLAHANFRFPENIDRYIGWVFITPNLHQVHHHNEQPFTDSNYGDVLSIWDRLFGTFRRMERETVTFGVDTYMNKDENAHIVPLLKIPFGAYRPSLSKIIEQEEVCLSTVEKYEWSEI
jgi:sterol desaturase/sphingolipid hydroxylase (fatty acid hydroxylase superfamily)